jgi:small-conductance mechanosensitive channel
MPQLEDGVIWQNWAWGIVSVALAGAIGAVIHAIVFSLAHRIARRARNDIANRLASYAQPPSRLIFPMLAIQLVIPALVLLFPEAVVLFLRHALGLVLIVGIAWLVIAMARIVDDVVGLRYRIDVSDNLAARRIHTQARVLRQSVTVLVIIITIAAMLMTFPQVRQLGASLLASAGLAGIVVGFAARPVLQNLIAGVQLAITQPIRIDDVLIIDGEFCRVEEISSTYVVMRIWDQRRLIVPLNFFIENTFQNWTRTSAEILGTVFLWVDYTVPVEELRQELGRLLEASDKWDKRAWGLQVVETSERAVQLRALMSAPDAGTAWDLRCHIREKLIEFLQKNYPHALPRVRADVAPLAGGMVPAG